LFVLCTMTACIVTVRAFSWKVDKAGKHLSPKAVLGVGGL